MPKVMLRRTEEGMTLYVPKQDLEEKVVGMEHPGPGQWGGEIKLADGSSFVIDVMAEEPKLPITIRAKRG